MPSVYAQAPGTPPAFPLPVGIHPRIFFGPEGLPALKVRLTQSEHGRVIKKISDQEYKNNKAGLQSFAALDVAHADKETLQKYVSTYFRSDEQRNILWGMWSLDAVAYDDADKKKLMCDVVTNYARLILASKALGQAEVTGGTGDSLGKTFKVWQSDSFDVNVSWLFGGGGFPLSYDLLYNDMTEEQRGVVRSAIAAATRGRRPFGSDSPKGRAFSNWFGYHGELAVMLAAIEGETGYDAPTYNRIATILQNYFDIGFTPDGASHEDAYGPNLGLRAGSLGLLVMARKGQDVFKTEKYRNIVRWFAQELHPYPGGNMVGGASGNVLVYPTAAIVAKYTLPDDPAANYVYRYLMGDNYLHGLKPQCWLDFALFGSDWSGSNIAPASLAEAHLSLGVFYPERGKLIARTNWLSDALVLHFDARPDAFAIGHDTVERGNFSLFALGRAWTGMPAFRDTVSSMDFSLVHIDGKGQEWKAPSVRFLWHSENEQAAGGAADLSYAYNYQWSPPWPTQSQKFPAPWEPELSDPRTLGWPGNPDWLPHKLYGEEGIGHVGMYMWRRPYNPVQKAFRTALLTRGPHPYVLVMDDIRKDDTAHRYDWVMQIAAGLTIESSDGRDVVLKEAQGDRRLLVRVLQGDRYTGAENATQTAYVIKSDPKTKAEVRGNRLVLSAQTVEPKWKILLFPFHSGQALPETKWNAAQSRVSLSWANQRDEITFVPDTSGRTQTALSRGGKTLVATK